MGVWPGQSRVGNPLRARPSLFPPPLKKAESRSYVFFSHCFWVFFSLFILSTHPFLVCSRVPEASLLPPWPSIRLPNRLPLALTAASHEQGIDVWGRACGIIASSQLRGEEGRGGDSLPPSSSPQTRMLAAMFLCNLSGIATVEAASIAFGRRVER
ncbi:hypothetical protein F5X96DRAFT_145038 [Biscogniauxia mediterranea]|nr:hypothetical protein F5X96DRAFT_145038 [Biscogniauxia mediterranea]